MNDFIKNHPVLFTIIVLSAMVLLSPDPDKNKGTVMPTAAASENPSVKTQKENADKRSKFKQDLATVVDAGIRCYVIEDRYDRFNKAISVEDAAMLMLTAPSSCGNIARRSLLAVDESAERANDCMSLIVLRAAERSGYSGDASGVTAVAEAKCYAYGYKEGLKAQKMGEELDK